MTFSLLGCQHLGDKVDGKWGKSKTLYIDFLERVTHNFQLGLFLIGS